MKKLSLLFAGVILCGGQARAVQTSDEKPKPQFTFDCSNPDSAEILSACAQMSANQLAIQSNMIAENVASQEARAVTTSQYARNDAQIGMWASVASALSSMVGMIFLFFTLRDGGKTANAAVLALDIGRAMLMPKQPLFRVKMAYQPNGDLGFCKVTLGVEWQNVGERPAIHVSKLTRLSIVPKGEALPSLPSYIQAGEWITVEAGGVFWDTITIANMVEIESYLLDKKDFYIVSSVAFRDRVKPDVNYASHLILRAKPINLQSMKDQKISEFEAHLETIFEKNVHRDQSNPYVNSFLKGIAKIYERHEKEG